VLGIISERDIARAVADRGAALGDMRVGDLMTREVVTCAPDDSIGEIMAIMTERRFRHLPVMQDGAMCGIISIGDVVKSRLEEVENEAAAMREYIAGN
jgi:CBS domain-containing protein